jgi:amidase
MMNAMYGSNMPNGWTPRGGQCISTYGGGYDPSGSSGGCAVAVSAGFAAAALAVETCGSIVSVVSPPFTRSHPKQRRR